MSQMTTMLSNVNMAADTELEIFNSSSRGRSVRTKVSCKAGKELLVCDPYIFVLRSELHGKICNECLCVSEGLQCCSRCKIVYYCGRGCQKVAWKRHKLECTYLRRISPRIPPDTLRLLALLLLKNTEQCEHWVKQLTTHCEEIKHEKSEIFGHILALLHKYLDIDSEIKNETIFELFCKIHCNTFTISDGEMKPVGLGLFPTASFINHSCRPNCVAVFLGAQCHIRSIEDIQGGEELCISYTELLRPHYVRKKELHKQYFFDCMCALCAEEITHGTVMDSLKCTNKDCLNPVGFQPDTLENRCITCGTPGTNSWSSHENVELYQRIENTLSLSEAMVEPDQSQNALNMFESLLSDMETILHPFNYQVLRILDKASDACIEAGLWNKALTYCKKSLAVYQKFYPKYHPSIGLQLYRIGKLELHLGMLDAGIISLSQAKDLLEISHGSTHPLFQQLRQMLFQACQEKQFLPSAMPGRMIQEKL